MAAVWVASAVRSGRTPGFRKGNEVSEMPLRCTVLDDHEGVASALADWASVRDRVVVRTVREHISDQAELAELLHDDEIVVVMRERTAFPESLFAQLPRLRLLVT